MSEARRIRRLAILLGVLTALSAGLVGCNLPAVGAGEGFEPATAGAATAAAVLTETGPGIRATGESLQTQPASPPSPSAPSSPATGTATPPTGSCEYEAAFIDDITVRDNTRFDPGESFVKVWRLRNSGDCSWTPGFLLTFFGGSRMSAPSTVALSQEVRPGEVVDLAVDMQAPSSPGTYQGFWRLLSPQGEYFGIGPQGDQSFWVKIQVPAPPTPEASATNSPTATATASPTLQASPTPSATASQTATEAPTASPSPSASPTESPTPTTEGV